MLKVDTWTMRSLLLIARSWPFLSMWPQLKILTPEIMKLSRSPYFKFKTGQSLAHKKCLEWLQWCRSITTAEKRCSIASFSYFIPRLHDLCRLHFSDAVPPIRHLLSWIQKVFSRAAAQRKRHLCIKWKIQQRESINCNARTTDVTGRGEFLAEKF